MKATNSAWTRKAVLGFSVVVVATWLIAAVSSPSRASSMPPADPWLAAWDGSRRPLIASALAVSLSLLLGTAFGLATVRGGGTTDRVARRVLSTLGSLPTVLLVGIFVPIFPTHPSFSLGVGVGLGRAAEVALLVRIFTIRFKASPAYEASRCLGSKPAQLAVSHIAPRLMASISQSVVLSIASVTVMDAALTYIRFPFPGPGTSWGEVIAHAASSASWTSALPSLLAVVSTTVAALVIGTFGRESRDKQIQPRMSSCVSER